MSRSKRYENDIFGDYFFNVMQSAGNVTYDKSFIFIQSKLVNHAIERNKESAISEYNREFYFSYAGNETIFTISPTKK